MLQRERLYRKLTAALALALIGMAAPGFLRAADPVEDLQQALVTRQADAPSRAKELQARIAQLKTVGDLRRALSLKEWRDDADDKLMQPVDLQARGVVGERLIAAARVILKNGSPTSRLALANLLAEMNATVRDVKGGGGFARGLTDEVIQLATDRDLGVRQEGLRALGNINAPFDKVLPVFASVLKTDVQMPRRLAADGLGQMIRVTNHLRLRGSAVGVGPNEKPLLSVTERVLQIIPIGLQDVDAQVRLASIDTVHEAVRTLSDLILNPATRKDFAPAGQKLTPAEEKAVNDRRLIARTQLAEIEGLFKALRNLNPDLARLLQDTDPRVQRAAIETVASLGYHRARLLDFLGSVPVLGDTSPYELPRLVVENDPLLGFVQKDWVLAVRMLDNPDERVRRSALDLLETLLVKAEWFDGKHLPTLPVLQAVPALTKALCDPDHFVRWAAVRTLSSLPPEYAQPAVPAIGKLLFDPDYNVKLAAAAALEALGPNARPALPSLTLALLSGDPESRVLVMLALQRVGPESAAAAIPNLIELLSHPDPRVRRTAAQTLGNLGPLAQAAMPALRRTIGDEDQEVRISASDALLNVIPVPGLNP